LPIVARLMSNGTPVSGATLKYQITAGTGTLGAASAQTSSNGNASVNLQLSSLATLVRVNVCVAPNSSPCEVFTATMVQASLLQVQAVSGILQVVPAGGHFAPVAVRIIDSDTPPHAVLGTSVGFIAYLGRLPGNEPILWAGDGSISVPT